VRWNSTTGIHGNAKKDIVQLSHLIQIGADIQRSSSEVRYIEPKLAAVQIRLNLMPLSRKVKVRLCCDK